MHLSKPFSTQVVMSALTGLQSVVALLGNGSILAVIHRFKSLRTVPNILIANLSIVDLLNAAINLPLHLFWSASWFKGKTLAIMTSFFERLFIILNLVSMLALMANMYFAIAFDLKYFAWKTNKKAVVCSCLIWIICIVLVVLYSIPLLSIDIGDAHVTKYKAEIFQQGKYVVAVFVAFFIICGTVLGFITTHSILEKKKKV